MFCKLIYALLRVGLLFFFPTETKNENREAWQRYGEDQYLLWQRKGTDCKRAQEYCEKRSATLAVIDQNNVVQYSVPYVYLNT